ncbi:MAG: hypothetical protein P8130_03710 [Deltaproteobacteria bacterium]
MGTDLQTAAINRLMSGFAERTGLNPPGTKPIRYLWTDAFAVSNFLELFLRTGERTFKDLALCLIQQVHHTLGRHREDDSRHGWISGLNEQQGEIHPTAGGLRIGKKLPERGRGELFDQVLEWDRDGQYYHYLIKWMQALNRTALITGNQRYLAWAVELARAAHEGFVYTPEHGGGKRMFWKMSIDLSRPQVASMGQHDPLDGLTAYLEIKFTASTGEKILPGLLDQEIDVSGALSMRPEYRLAFREFGLAIGLAAIENLHTLLANHHPAFDNASLILTITDQLLSYASLREDINKLWQIPANQQTSTWREHREINTVMLATSLAPACFLTLPTDRFPLPQ